MALTSFQKLWQRHALCKTKKVEVVELSIHIIEIREKPCNDCGPISDNANLRYVCFNNPAKTVDQARNSELACRETLQ